MTDLWLVLELNPEPWRVGPVGIHRKGGRVGGHVGRDQQLDAYKNAVAEQVMLKLGWKEGDPLVFDSKVKLTIYFWRVRSSYSTPQARTHRKHEADGTNLFKATEDALQGILYKNDKDNSRGNWEIVEQGENTVPRIIIHAEPYIGLDPNEIPDSVWSSIDDLQGELDFYERWA